ncbi:MAG: hypothetical protein QW791_08830 [Candidatus Bathyarchaeia archaeon]
MSVIGPLLVHVYGEVEKLGVLRIILAGDAIVRVRLCVQDVSAGENRIWYGYRRFLRKI